MPSTRIADLFRRTREENRAALIAYITAGDPTPELTPRIAEALERGGVDLIELGVPFSDPIADGPVIQKASDRALRQGVNVSRVLEIAREIRASSRIPLLLFTYLNPILRYGLERLAADAAAAGIDGCLLTDLSVEEAEKYIGVMRTSGLDTVFLAAPTSTAGRRELVARYSTGFVYLVSRTGVTGESASVADSAGALVEAMRPVTPLPLAVGFGISTRGQVAAVARIADGVVVGSALVRLIEEHGGDPKLVERVEAFARELAGGLRREVPA